MVLQGKGSLSGLAIYIEPQQKNKETLETLGKAKKMNKRGEK